MIGAVVITVVIVIAIPVVFLMSMAIPASVFGALLKERGEETHPDSELVDVNY